MTSFFVNGKPVQVDVDPATPLLWVLRDSLEMTGTKFSWKRRASIRPRRYSYF